MTARHGTVGAIARDLCLSYANTRYWRGTDPPTESLTSVADLLRWLGGAAGYDTETIAAAERWGGEDPQAAARLFAEALAIREVVYRLFSAVASGRPVGEDDIRALNRALDAAPERSRIVLTDGSLAWQIGYDAPTAPLLLAPVLWSAADLIVGGKNDRLRQCANDKCLWLFLDDSKSATRRWCDMKSCGNRLKARRHYLKTKQGRGVKPAV